MKAHLFKRAVLALLATLPLLASAQIIDGTFTATESWSVTLEYDDFAGGFTGVKHFSGRETGTLVIHNGQYHLINRTGFQIQANDQLLARSIVCFGGSCSIDGYYAFGPGYNAHAYGVLFLGGFVVKVPLIDGEVPAFYDYDYFSASGSLSAMQGGGDMIGVSLRATVSSSLSITPKTTPSTSPPKITGQSRSVTVDYGRRAVLTAHASGTPPLSFQWWRDGALVDGATSAKLTLNQATTEDAGSYAVTVSNGFGEATTEVATLTVRPPIAPTFRIQPRDLVVKQDHRLRLLARAKGSMPLAYQWFFNGDSVPGANTNSFVVLATQPANAGSYFIVASNVAGSVTSRVATVTVKVPVP